MVSSGSAERPVRIGDVSNSAFSIGGSNNTNTVHNGAAEDRPPTAAELLRAVRDLRVELVQLPRSSGRGDLDAELEDAAAELEGAGEIRPGLAARLRGALERWAPLVETMSAATALAGLLTGLGG
ncbi:hypothetical protein WDV06_15950 [Streptomyces racemochromogenes]|uniref:Uncharacterized protein n=1 Tax=Streptomyces racemochromogenes TaxID=67353 RepID=A0ABW7PDV5_9ACTN